MNISEIISAEYENTLSIIRDLCKIPAPSGLEDERAKYCLDFFKKLGVGVSYIDESKNAICALGPSDGEKVLFAAHTDTVFPDMEPLPFSEDEKNMYCPGVGDDTACLAVLMSCAKFLAKKGTAFNRRIIFAANSCEEGLGNLKGMRQIFTDYPEIVRMYTFDGMYDAVVSKSVGSHRYKLTVKTEGGHSFNHFGNRNAIAVLCDIIGKIYCIEVPKRNDSRTTYNVGTIEGGTSVNTIAQEACCLVEYRSDNAECMAEMQKKFNEIFESAKGKCKELTVELVGERPCGDGIDMLKQRTMTDKVAAVQNKYSGLDIKINSGSTDCNIPHSLGIPAVCVGVHMGGGMHTREEWAEKESIKTGLEIALDLIGNEAFGG